MIWYVVSRLLDMLIPLGCFLLMVYSAWFFCDVYIQNKMLETEIQILSEKVERLEGIAAVITSPWSALYPRQPKEEEKDTTTIHVDMETKSEEA